MNSSWCATRRLSATASAAVVAVAASATIALPARATPGSQRVSAGRAWFGALNSTAPTGGGAPLIAPGLPTAGPGQVPAPPGRHAKGHWLGGVTITQYWPAPESWFVGRLVHAPGLPGLHHIDWLYSAQGISMQGDGIGLDGQLYHIQQLGRGGWVTSAGRPTSPDNGWAAGAPYWRAGGYWLARGHTVTFPLATGGWSNGTGRRYVPLRGVSFAAGDSLPLLYWRSIAVDPSVIPLGSRVYVPAYRNDGYGGWFVAQDTGGAIGGRHIDVYRSAPVSPLDAGGLVTGARIFVIKPGRGH
ncbi:MAG: 3D domain-containing protein [Solirubrobacteraceae bacterium]